MSARAGFTLTELLIAMALGAMAIALMAPMAQMSAREHARSAVHQVEREAVLSAFAGLRALALEAQPGRIRRLGSDADWFEADGSCFEFSAVSEGGPGAPGPYLAQLCVEAGETRSQVRFIRQELDFSGQLRGEDEDHILIDGPFEPNFEFAARPKPGEALVWSSGWTDERAPAFLRFRLGEDSRWPDLVLTLPGGVEGAQAPVAGDDDGPPPRNPRDPRDPRVPPGGPDVRPPFSPGIAQ